MSDSDNEDLESDEEEDLDYVPEGEEDDPVDEASEESGKSEDGGSDSEDAAPKPERQSKRLKKKSSNWPDWISLKISSQANLKRGRTRRGVFYADQSNDADSEEVPSKKSKVEDENEKKRVDDLWSSFLSDVNTVKPKPSSQKILVQKGTKVEVEGGDSSSSDFIPSSSGASNPPDPDRPKPKSAASEKITITKVFDFAGEEIKVTKDVSIDSEEAKEELAKRQKAKISLVTSETSTTTTATSLNSSTCADSKDKSSSCSSEETLKLEDGISKTPKSTSLGLKTTPGSVVAASSPSSAAVNKILALSKQKPAATAGPSPKSGLSSIMNKIGGGPKKKMSVLEKSAMDWKTFKDKEGISEELATFNKGKGGFLEKQKFLREADYRQFEMERNLRLGKR